MSANRSVQAAQRRRAGQQDGAVPGRTPQPSINSAQMFANQARPGQGPSIPTGRLAGQQAAMQQKQIQQQSYQQNQQQPEGLAGVSKMTIAQAITLITLRLGAVETKIMSLEHEPSASQISFEGQENMALIDKNAIQSIASRLESLEKRSTTGSSIGSSSGSSIGSASGPEVALLKQQFEIIKQTAIQSKSSTVTLVKENKELKNQLDNLTKEMIETKDTLNAIKQLVMNNSEELIKLSCGDFNTRQFGESEMFEGNMDYNTLLETSNITDLQDDGDSDEIVGTNLKELIESEINANL